MKVALVTSAFYRNGLPRFVEHTEKLKFVYCVKWKMEYRKNRTLTYPDCHPVWEKLPLVKRVLNEGMDWVIWMDADAAPVTMDVDIPSYLEGEERKVIMIKDNNGINNGVFAVPNEKVCLDWLSYIEGQRHNPKYRSGWKEQNAMRDSFEQDWGQLLKEPPGKIGWNNYLDIYDYENKWNLWHEGDWCLHIPACKDDVREKTFGKFAEGNHA